MPVCPHCRTEHAELFVPCSKQDGFYTIEESEARAYHGDPLMGVLVSGRYIICSVIGHGSIGRVYKAHQLGIERPVVLKIFKLEHILDEQQGFTPGLTIQEAREDAQDRFIREARVLGQITHPNCVTIYDFGAADDGSFLYIAMEFVAGISMRQAIKRGLRADATLDIMRQILMALRDAHAIGVIHRDLKPENIILSFRKESQEAVVKVLDFGIAKLLHREQQTNTGMLFGTPAYMSPEQCRGESDRVSPASDIYSLGCMFYELVCGRLPFESRVPQQMILMHLDEPVPTVTPREGMELPEGLDAFITRCLSKAPSDRFANAKLALDQLDRLLTPEHQLRFRAAAATAQAPSERQTRAAIKAPQSVVSQAGLSTAPSQASPVGQAALSTVTSADAKQLAAGAQGYTVIAPTPSGAGPLDTPVERTRTLIVTAVVLGLVLMCVLLFAFFYKVIMSAP